VQVGSASLITNPARDTDPQPHCEIFTQGFVFARETVSNSSCNSWQHRLEHINEVVVRVALVQKDWHGGFSRDIQLSLESIQLCLARRKVAEIVQPALSDRHNGILCSQFANQAGAAVVEIGGMVWVYACRGVKAPWLGFGEIHGIQAALVTAARNDHPGHAGILRTPHHLGAVFVKAVVGQVCTNIDKIMGHFFESLLQPIAHWGYLMSTNAKGI